MTVTSSGTPNEISTRTSSRGTGTRTRTKALMSLKESTIESLNPGQESTECRDEIILGGKKKYLRNFGFWAALKSNRRESGG